jgi:hypothetical protein
MVIKQEQINTQQGQSKSGPSPVGLQAAQTQIAPTEQPGALAELPKKIGGYPIALFTLPEVPELSEEVKADLAEDMDGITVQFDQVKIPSGGGTAWELPNPDDPKDPGIAKEIAGVIVDHYRCNAWWEGEYGGGNTPPDCSSMDATTGIDKQGQAHNCGPCPHNQYETDPKGGKGKACKNMHRVYLLQDSEDTFPLLVTIPPTSLKNFANYLGKRVVSRGLRSFDVITKLTLSKAESTDKKPYSQVNFAVTGVIDPVLREGMKAYSVSIRTITRQMMITTADYNATGETTDPASGDSFEAPETESHLSEDQPKTEVYKGSVKDLPKDPPASW